MIPEGGSAIERVANASIAREIQDIDGNRISILEGYMRRKN